MLSSWELLSAPAHCLARRRFAEAWRHGRHVPTNPGGEMLPEDWSSRFTKHTIFVPKRIHTTSSSLASTCCSSHLEHDAGHSRDGFWPRKPQGKPGFLVTIGFGVARGCGTVHKLEHDMLHQVFFLISAQRSAKMVAFSIVAQLENEEIICNSNSVTIYY